MRLQRPLNSQKKGDLISAKVFQAFYSENFRVFPDEVRTVWVCDMLGITYSELIKQPAEWVNMYIVYLEGKSKAEKQKMKQNQKTK